MDGSLLTLREAAEKTRLSMSWWRARVFRREIRFVKLGRRVLIPEETIARLIQLGTVEPSNGAPPCGTR
jgi:excisionase family DNA binding protein